MLCGDTVCVIFGVSDVVWDGVSGVVYAALNSNWLKLKT